MSDTPRTDNAASMIQYAIVGEQYQVVTAEFARTLERELAAAKGMQSEIASTDLARLKEIEHLAWHLLDDSEENAQSGAITIRPMREDYDKLSAILPEDHP